MISRRLLTTSLEQFGHTVDAYENGVDAWEAFNAEPVRIIISDWLMPEMDGLELCRRVRNRSNTEYTYFILLTANAQGKDEYFEAMQAGIDDFLSKPMDRDTVWMRLRVAERILRYTKEISDLESMLPICSYCKKVRDDNNYWQQVESYILQQTGTSFSHSVCPTCYETKVMPQLEALKNG